MLYIQEADNFRLSPIIYDRSAGAIRLDGSVFTAGIKIEGATTGQYHTPADAVAGGGYAIKVLSTSSFQAVAAHKALWIDHTHTPSSAGTACPIAIVGKLTIAGDNTASKN